MLHYRPELNSTMWINCSTRIHVYTLLQSMHAIYTVYARQTLFRLKLRKREVQPAILVKESNLQLLY